MRSFCVYGANTALYCFICVLNPTFSCSDCVQLVFIAATGSSRTGFSDGFILASGVYAQPVNADTIIVHNGYCKGFVSNALHRTFAVALVARTSHAGFVNEFTGTIALATSNYIRHIHTPPYIVPIKSELVSAQNWAACIVGNFGISHVILSYTILYMPSLFTVR